MNYKPANIRKNNALPTGNVDDFRHRKYHEFTRSINTISCYRISAIPFDLNPDAISLGDPKIQEILFSPPHERLRGFGVRGFLRRETYQELDGIKGSNIGLDHGEIILQRNGYLEYRCPIVDSYFFWGKKLQEYTIFDEMNWLYPLVVCEHPVSFLRLVRELYTAAGITSPFVVIQEYHNLFRFALPAGAPDFSSLIFCLDGAHRRRSFAPIISDTTVDDPNFDPDKTAYSLLKNVYTAFGLRETAIPFFDKWGKFSRNNNKEVIYEQSYSPSFSQL